MKSNSFINNISIVKRIIWILFFTQQFWGFYLPTSLPVWFAIIVMSLIIYFNSKNRITSFEKLLISFIIFSVLGWVITDNISLVNFNSDSRNVLQHFIFALSVLLTIQSPNDINTFLKDAKWFVWGTIIFSFLSVFNGTFFNTGNVDSTSGFERAGGWIGIPNAYSAFIVLSIIISLYQLKIIGLKRYKYLIVILFIFLLTTLSRNGFVAALVFTFYFLYKYYVNNKKKRNNSMLKPAVKFAIISSIVVIILLSNFQEVIEGAMNRDITIDRGDLKNTRLLFWTAQFIAIGDWNFEKVIFGVNYDNILNNLEYGLGYRLPQQIVLISSPVENGALYVFIGSGAIGLLLLILMYVFAWRNLNKPEVKKEISYFIKGLILALLIQTMFMDFMYLGIKTYYFAFLGLSFKFTNIELKTRSLEVST
jgi:hypothetical protein